MTSIWAEKFDHAAAVDQFRRRAAVAAVGHLLLDRQPVAGLPGDQPRQSRSSTSSRASATASSASPIRRSCSARCCCSAINVALGALCYALLRSGWKLKSLVSFMQLATIMNGRCRTPFSAETARRALDSGLQCAEGVIVMRKLLIPAVAGFDRCWPPLRLSRSRSTAIASATIASTRQLDQLVGRIHRAGDRRAVADLDRAEDRIAALESSRAREATSLRREADQIRGRLQPRRAQRHQRTASSASLRVQVNRLEAARARRAPRPRRPPLTKRTTWRAPRLTRRPLESL